MTTGGAGDAGCGRDTTTGGGGGRIIGGGRTGGGGADCSPNKRRNSSSQLVGRGDGRGWPAAGRACGGLAVESSRPSTDFFFIHAAIADTIIRTNAVINESISRRYLGCWPGVEPLPPPPMLSRMPVSAWMFRIR